MKPIKQEIGRKFGNFDFTFFSCIDNGAVVQVIIIDGGRMCVPISLKLHGKITNVFNGIQELRDSIQDETLAFWSENEDFDFI